MCQELQFTSVISVANIVNKIYREATIAVRPIIRFVGKISLVLYQVNGLNFIVRTF